MGMKIPDVNDVYIKKLKTRVGIVAIFSRKYLFNKYRKTVNHPGTGLISLIIIVAILISALPAGAQNQPAAYTVDGSNGFNVLPRNPDFIDYQTEMQFGSLEHPMGYVPPPTDYSLVKGIDTFSTRRTQIWGPTSFPSSFDLRPPYVTNVSDQGRFGTCWAFATYGSLESTLLKEGHPGFNFSEKNLVDYSGFDLGPNNGGNYQMSAAYLARWDGPVLESDDPYSDPWGAVLPGPFIIQNHTQDVYFLPNRANGLDNDNIKSALMNYGAVAAMMYWNGSDSTFYSNYSATNHAYYYSRPHNPNHGVTIVGWDDNFLATNFSTMPPGNGAFIVKNSWGTSWLSESGYFYISYYDNIIGNYTAVFTTEQVNNYQHLYQYDPFGQVDYIGNGTVTTYWYANIFQANSNEQVKAVSYYTLWPSTTYEISVYTDVTSDPMTGNGPYAVTTGTLDLPGYNTVDLSQAVDVPVGHRFSIIVRVSGGNYNIPIEDPIIDYSSAATANPGEGYISFDGTSWDDITDIVIPGMNMVEASICIKAFTDDASLPTLQFSSDSYSVNENDPSHQVTITVTKTGIGACSVHYATASGGSNPATPGTHYNDVSGTLNFAMEDTQQTFTVPILEDHLYDGPTPRTFTVTLSSESGVLLGSPSAAVVSIINVDPVPTFQFNASSYTISENGGTLTVNVTRANDALDTVNVNYTTINGTAQSGIDYSVTNGTLSFARGIMSQTFPVPIHNDGIYGPVKMFTITLSDPTGGAELGTPSITTVSITETDAAPVVSMSLPECEVDEYDGTTFIEVTRINDAINPVTVQYNTSDGTAVAGMNYMDTNGVLTFNKSEMSHTIQVPIIDDGAPGSDVTFNVTLSGPTGGTTLGIPNSTMVTINESYRTFAYSLLKGWSMISVPFKLNNSSVEAFFPAAVRANLTDMWYYDNGSWVYYSGIRGYSPKYSHLTNVTPGKGYWVKLSNNSSFTVGGTLNGTGVPAVSSGWTMFGVKDLGSVNATMAYPGNKDLWYYDNGQWYYYSGTRGYSPKYPHLNSLDPGKGYWVHY